MLSAAARFALVLGAFVTHAVRKNEEATRELIREVKARMRAELERMDVRAEERRSHSG